MLCALTLVSYTNKASVQFNKFALTMVVICRSLILFASLKLLYAVIWQSKTYGVIRGSKLVISWVFFCF